MDKNRMVLKNAGEDRRISSKSDRSTLKETRIPSIFAKDVRGSSVWIYKTRGAVLPSFAVVFIGRPSEDTLHILPGNSQARSFVWRA